MVPPPTVSVGQQHDSRDVSFRSGSNMWWQDAHEPEKCSHPGCDVQHRHPKVPSTRHDGLFGPVPCSA